ncbi:translation initiation factor IF-2 N-terminal domain-containing protein, partial [Intrasporangium chromatireducens]|uniref:translation initiation factor IF-2 N-terminal domain-containing protein n=1 Tax=Intrasporangium chromatireducens TaxID=1386088 RepID=UPI00054EF29C
MAKVRVYELAKELGVESKVLLAHLKSQGEFVRSASSTIEPPVVRKIKETFPQEHAAASGKPAARKTAKSAPSAPARAEAAARPSAPA